MSTSKTTTIRVNVSTKNKADELKKDLSYDKYISSLNNYVENNNVDLKESPTSIPSVIKKNTEAIKKILRAFEKDYLIKIKGFSELLLEQTTIEKVGDIDNNENLIKELNRKIHELEKNITLNEISSVDNKLKSDITDIVNEIIIKANESLNKDNSKVVFSPFYIKQKLDFLKNKVSKL